MKKNEAGFSVIELLLVIGVIALLAGLGYLFYQRQQKSKASNTTAPTTTVQSKAAAPATGTTSSIDNLTAQDAASESTIDAKHTTGEATTAQSANPATANVGGAYNESSL